MATQPPSPLRGIPASPDQNVASTFTTALVLGVYLVTLVFTLRWLLFADEGWKRRKSINRSIATVATFMFVLTVACSAIDLKSTMDEIRLLMTDPGVQYTIPTWMSICKCMFTTLIVLLADLVLIYRCYIVCARGLWVIAFPCFLWTGSVICTGVQAYLQITHLHNPYLGPYLWASVNMTAGPGIVLIPFWGSTTVLNVYCTTLLVGRIYQAASAGSGASPAITRQFRFIARTIVESGIIYMSISLAQFVVWFTRDNFAIQVVGAINVPLIGISFNLILIRTALSRSDEYGKTTTGQLTSIKFNRSHSHKDIIGIHPESKGFEPESQAICPV